MIGTRASAGWMPPKYMAHQDSPPPTPRYGQKLIVRNFFSAYDRPIAGTIRAAKVRIESGPVG